MAKAKKSGLGKGLDSLIPDSLGIEHSAEVKHEPIMIKIIEIEPNKSQPRREFDEEELEKLADSITQHGIIQPILVQKRDDYYEIIAGERRWRAAKKIGLKEVPALVREYSEQELYEIALIENLQRKDLNPIEEAQAYKHLIDEYNLTQEEVAKRVSKSRANITNMLRLLKLSDEVQELVSGGKISYGHARALLGISDKKTQADLAKRIVDKQLSVRETEQLAKKVVDEKKKNKPKKKAEKSFVYRDIEEKITERMGTKVVINEKEPGKGKLEIEYYSAEELERIYDLLMSVSQTL